MALRPVLAPLAAAWLPSLSLAHGQVDPNAAARAALIASADLRAVVLAADGPGSGWSNGRFAAPDGGTSTLSIGGYSQFRYLADARSEQPDPGDFTHGFQAHRTRLTAGGTLWDAGITYALQGDFARTDGTFTLTDAFGRYSWDGGVHLKWGQFKLPLLREELVSSTRQLTVERSAVNATFTQSRSQGVELGYATERFRAFAALSDGLSTPNTDFIDAAEADLGVTARAEWMVAGREFKRFDDNTSWRQSGTAAMLGGAIHHQWGGETGGTLYADVTQGTLDASVEGDGWNAFVAGVWRHRDSGGGDPDDFGIVVQGGVFATERLEFFVRYDVLLPDAGDAFETATAGFNCYITPRSHALKLTGDVVYYLDQTDATPIVRTGTALPLLVDMEGDQVVLRLQFQIVF